MSTLRATLTHFPGRPSVFVTYLTPSKLGVIHLNFFENKIHIFWRSIARVFGSPKVLNMHSFFLAQSSHKPNLDKDLPLNLGLNADIRICQMFHPTTGKTDRNFHLGSLGFKKVGFHLALSRFWGGLHWILIRL